MFHLKIEFPHVPPSLNITLRTHYHKRNKLFKDYYNLISAVTRDQRPPEPLKKAKIKIERHFYRMLDYDNLVSSQKCIIDGLIHCGVIQSDSWKILGIWDVNQVFRQKKLGPLTRLEVIGETQFK